MFTTLGINIHFNVLKVRAQNASRQSGGGFPNFFSSPHVLTKLKNDPRTASYLSDPSYLALLAELQSNPQSIATKIQDPRILNTLQVLTGLDTSRFHTN